MAPTATPLSAPQLEDSGCIALPDPVTPPRTRLGVVGASILALSLVGLGALGGTLWRYQTTPGPAAPVRAQWPAAAPLVRDASVPTMVVLVHPRCPCTRASLVELASVLATAPALQIFVVIRTHADDDAQGENVERARALPGATVVFDPDGTITAAFGPLTSGHVLLYTAAGDLAFSGGVTLARGEIGDSPGRRALVAALADAASATTTPVFGCPLEGDDASEAPRA